MITTIAPLDDNWRRRKPAAESYRLECTDCVSHGAVQWICRRFQIPSRHGATRLFTAKKHYGKDGEHRIDLNGKWLSSHGTYGEDETDDRRYPRLDDCLPDCSDYTMVGLDPQQLINLLQALDVEDGGLTLLVPKPDERGHVGTAVGIVGECGIGVIMPCYKADKTTILPDYRQEFNETAEAYKAAVSTANLV